MMRVSVFMLGALALSIACSGPQPSPEVREAQPAPPQVDDVLAPSPYDGLPETARLHLDEPFTGDLDQMVTRRLIRAGVVFNRTMYFIDRGVQRGMAYESLKLFEEELNRRLKTGALKVHVAFIPLQRDQLLSALNEGKVDLVAATLTVTPEREKLVAFSAPTRSGVSEVVVTSATAPSVTTADDLSGRDVFVRRSSSYYESLVELNAELGRRGRPAVVIREAPEVLEDDDLLEMVNAGLVDATVADDFVASFWQQVFPDIRVHPSADVRTGGSIAVAVRKSNPRLLQAVNTWIGEYGLGTAFGNVVERRYLKGTEYVRRAADQEERRKFEAIVTLFRTYGERYELDYLLMAAQGYQESRLDHSVRSKVGAVGVMQVMPATGRDLNVGDITKIEPNIHAGIKYMRFMMDEYFKDEPMDDLNKVLMTLAAYNAGPGRIRQLRREAAARGLNPNVWFGNVERIASERVGRETVGYVGNIYKYYVAYRLVQEQTERRTRAKMP
jgi:membrane-bound lytic murein transglycosylase MltF